MSPSSSCRATALGCVLFLLASSGAQAHDPGISRARLLERGPGDYVLEVDASPMAVTALAPPVLPERFTLDERPDQVDRGGFQHRDGFVHIGRSVHLVTPGGQVAADNFEGVDGIVDDEDRCVLTGHHD